MCIQCDSERLHKIRLHTSNEKGIGDRERKNTNNEAEFGSFAASTSLISLGFKFNLSRMNFGLTQNPRKKLG